MLPLLVLFANINLIVVAYQRGDVVSTLARTQYAGWRTPWTELARSEMPIFREPSIVLLAPPVPQDADETDESKAFQLSLAFSESRFVVPWVSTRTQHGDKASFRLRYLKITFLYSGSDILQVKWDGDYKPFSGSAVEQSNQLKQGSTTRPATSLQVYYEWVEVVEHDLESGLVVMFGVCLALALAALLIMCNREAGGSSSRPRDVRGAYGSAPSRNQYSHKRR